MKPLTLLSFFGFWVFGCLTASTIGAAEENSTILNSFSDEEQEKMKKGAESHQFQAEVNRLMDIIINSLYGRKEVFLRELISNAADALEKARFLSVSDPSIIATDPRFEIRIEADKDAQTLTLQDTGVGMTKQELVNNLGTVARSGTTNFLEALSSGMDLNLIGQFGVGFYSAFLVADKVTVISKSQSDPVQHVWVSSADASFTVSPDPRGNTLKRGTQVVLHLKDDSTEFLQPEKLQEVVTRFNQFVNFPIHVKLQKTKEEEVPADEPLEADAEVVKDPEAAANPLKIAKTKKVKRKYMEWEQVNKQKPIWLRPKDSVTESEYTEFYKDVLKDTTDPVAHIHFVGEGEVEFKSILYIPGTQPSSTWQSFFNTKQKAIKIYSRRVLVADETYDLVPQWLSFLKGVIDSDDLPLKVDRESFAQTKMMKVITKKIVGKFVEMVRKLSKEDHETWESYREDKKAKPDTAAPKTKFGDFWKSFGKSMKLGCIEDEDNRDKIANVFRWHTTKTAMNESISMDDYVARMPTEQKEILFVAHDNFDAALASPHVQLYKKKGWELIVASDPLDESCLQKLNTFRTKPIVSVEKTNVKISQTDDEKAQFKKVEKAFKPLTSFLEAKLRGRIGRVKVSQKLVDDPVVITTDAYGLSAYHERVIKSQSYSTYESGLHNRYRVLDLNPSHPLVTKMLEMVKADKDDPRAEALANTLLETALLSSGFTITNPSHLVAKLVAQLREEAGVPSDAVIEDFVVPDEPEEKEDDEDVLEDGAEGADVDEEKEDGSASHDEL